MKNKKIITRAAPSPNGFFHIGGVRMFLHNYAYAKKNNGEYILRMEDTDTKRSEVEAGYRIMDIAKRFGLMPDKYPKSSELDTIGDFSDSFGSKWINNTDKLEALDDSSFHNVFLQTKRSALYQKYAWQLIKKELAYFCFCSQERLKNINDQKIKDKLTLGYDRYCLHKHTPAEALDMARAGADHTVRLNIEKYIELYGNGIKYNDPILGEMEFDLESVNDQVLIKTNGVATYHLAVVVDDYLMNVSHALRGWEWIPSIPKQYVLYKVLGWEMPVYLHFNVILDPDKKGKLSKRSGSTFAIEFLKEGYIVEAILNFLMLLGWNSGSDREFYTLQEFIEVFDIKDIAKSNPIFDRSKLLWFNSHYLKKLSIQEFKDRFREWFVEFYDSDNNLKELISNDPTLTAKLALVKDRVRLLAEIPNYIEFFFRELDLPNYSEVKGLKRYDPHILRICREEYLKIIKQYPKNTLDWNEELWVKDIRELADKYNLKHADLFMLIRLHICRSEFSPPLFDSIKLMEYTEIIKRINA